jgi:phytol kinase
MTTGLPDWLALILAFVYVFVAIGVGELLRRSLHLSQGFTRKFIHIAVGMISIPTVLMFKSLYWAIIPPLAFIVINYLDYRFGLIQAMMSSNRSNLGTVYFPISFAVILAVFWGNPTMPTTHPHLIVAALMPLTWGDALAAVVGERIGRHRYTILGHTRSVEGSFIMLVVSVLATWLALGSLSSSAAYVAIIVAWGATLVEAISPWGIDNLTVPAVSALILALMRM